MRLRTKCAACGVVLAGAAAGCTNDGVAVSAKLGSAYRDFKVTLYSGGGAAREWLSQGQVQNEPESDGFYFKDKATGNVVRVSGNVAIEMVGGEPDK